MNNLVEKLNLLIDKCYSKELSACKLHTIFQRQKFVNEAIPIIAEEIKKELEDNAICAFSGKSVVRGFMDEQWQAFWEKIIKEG